MSDYTELVNALRICGKGRCVDCDRQRQDKCLKRYWNNEDLIDGMLCEAAAAIEALEAEVKRLEPKRGEMAEVVRCKDCKHRPTGTGVNHHIEFPDSRCPCQCYEDYWYSWMPSDDWYCGNGEKMEAQDDKV